ncbi:MAG: hypothetical protein KKF56_00735 [Nanoarchaeota archaeon]|nr:hypothetical protein [Nanoarchaeota archaeon]
MISFISVYYLRKIIGRRHFDRTLYGPRHPRANSYVINGKHRISLVESLGTDTAYVLIQGLGAERGNGYWEMQELIVEGGRPNSLNSLKIPGQEEEKTDEDFKGYVQLVDMFEVRDGINREGFPRRTKEGIVKIRFKPNERVWFKVQEVDSPHKK